MNKRIFIIVCGLSLVITSSAWFFVGDNSLINNTSYTTIIRGFPGHFYEYDPMINIAKFLPLNFLIDFFFYLFVVISLWYLLLLGFKNNNWYPLGIALLLSFISLKINIFRTNSCEVGFPIEFSSICEGDFNPTREFFLYGLIFDFTFWCSVFIVCIASLHEIFSLDYFKKFLQYRDLRFTFLGLWIIFTIFSFLLVFNGNILGIILSIISFLLLINIYLYYKEKSNDEGKRFLFSIFGYFILGVIFGLILISVVANLTYNYDGGGWISFDLRDVGFAIFSYPLISLVRFQPNADIFSRRIVLYLICCVNLFIITFILDVFGLICTKTYHVIKKSVNH